MLLDYRIILLLNNLLRGGILDYLMSPSLAGEQKLPKKLLSIMNGANCDNFPYTYSPSTSPSRLRTVLIFLTF
jgi:hypothetical protein